MEYLKIIKELYQSTPQQVFEKVEDEFVELPQKIADEELLFNLLHKSIGGDLKYIAHKWYELGIPNILAYTITVVDEVLEDEQRYLLKIFNKNFTAKAISEENLYKKANINALGIPFVVATEVNEFQVHIFRYYHSYSPVGVEEFHKKRLEIFKQINQFDINKQFIDEYQEKHEFIYERFTINNLQYLKIVCKEEDENILLWFEENIDSIIEDIKTLEFRLVTPLVTANTLLENPQGELKLISFHNWSIEPLGFGFMSIPELKILESITTELDYKKALIMHYFRLCERDYNTNKFYDVLKTLQKIKDIYEK